MRRFIASGMGIVGLVHIDELAYRRARRQLDRMKGGRLGRDSVVGVVGMIALTGDVDAAILKLVLIGNVVDERAFRHCESAGLCWGRSSPKFSWRQETAAHRASDCGLPARNTRRRRG